MGAIASPITSLMIVYSIVYSDADQRKHQSSASLAFVWGIHRRPVNSPHKGSVTRKMFPFDDVIMRFPGWRWLTSWHCIAPQLTHNTLKKASIGVLFKKCWKKAFISNMFQIVSRHLTSVLCASGVFWYVRDILGSFRCIGTYVCAFVLFYHVAFAQTVTTDFAKVS